MTVATSVSPFYVKEMEKYNKTALAAAKDYEIVSINENDFKDLDAVKSEVMKALKNAFTKKQVIKINHRPYMIDPLTETWSFNLSVLQEKCRKNRMILVERGMASNGYVYTIVPMVTQTLKESHF